MKHQATILKSMFGTAFAFISLVPSPAYANKQWDPYTGIVFDVSGTDDPVAPTDIGHNGLQTEKFTVMSYHDVDHWIDPDESVPNNEGYPDENLPYVDIIPYTDAPSPGGLSGKGPIYTYTSPSVGGEFAVDFTGTDQSQVLPKNESGSRRDPDNTDNWWDLPE